MMRLQKSLAVVSLCLFFLSCGKGSSGQTYRQADDAIKKQEAQEEEAQLTLAQSFNVRAVMFNFNEEQKQKVYAAIDLIKKVVASKEFRDEVLNYTFAGKKQFHENRGHSNEEIYQQILDASESVLSLGKNNIMDLELQLYREDTTTIGYTYPDVVRIYMNAKYFESFTPTQVADNLMHEWVHKLGYDHDMIYSPSRDHTVPYAVGYLVKKLAKKYSSPLLAHQ